MQVKDERFQTEMLKKQLQLSARETKAAKDMKFSNWVFAIFNKM